MQENELWGEVVNITQVNLVQVPTSTNATTLESFNEKDTKARRIILDVVKVHVIPHFSGKYHIYKFGIP